MQPYDDHWVIIFEKNEIKGYIPTSTEADIFFL